MNAFDECAFGIPRRPRATNQVNFGITRGLSVSCLPGSHHAQTLTTQGSSLRYSRSASEANRSHLSVDGQNRNHRAIYMPDIPGLSVFHLASPRHADEPAIIPSASHLLPKSLPVSPGPDFQAQLLAP